MIFLASAQRFSVGDRIAGEYEGGEWAVGTVTKVINPLKIEYIADDGEEDVWDLKEEVVLLLPPDTKRYINVLTKAKVDELVRGGLRKGHVTDPNEERLVTRFGDKRQFLNCADSKQETRRYLLSIWKQVNNVFFDGKLLPIEFKFLKDMGAKARKNGHWDVRRRVIAISPRIFNGTEAHALGVIVHEMCHQAVSDISKINAERNGGHGPVWAAHMRHCGLVPARYVTQDGMTNLHDGDRLDNIPSAQNSTQIDRDSIVTYHPVKFARGVKTEYGLIAGPATSSKFRGKIAISVKIPRAGSASIRWSLVDAKDLFAVTPAEKAKMKITQLEMLVDSIIRTGRVRRVE